MGFVRVLLGFLVVLVAVYLVLSVVLRLRERRRLAEDWEEGDRLVARGRYMDEGMAEYDRSLRKKLLWLVIVGPMAGLLILLYVLNIS